MLRLNDKDVTDSQGCIQSRLGETCIFLLYPLSESVFIMLTLLVVMRTHGNLRVVLNSKLWPAMCVDKASPKSVRVTVMDAEGVNIYLIQAKAFSVDPILSIRVAAD